MPAKITWLALDKKCDRAVDFAISVSMLGRSNDVNSTGDTQLIASSRRIASGWSGTANWLIQIDPSSVLNSCMLLLL
ncbi:MAG: hypothetical protein AB1704_15315 [Pseudomonadota bacterium]|uniref:hypothetical protein n=1 Tax=Burkholderiaceae TaxID=119060 RepID=UPI0010F9675C|nr:hypothetical protein [Burkholderia sp. 4M9327F10]